MNARTMWILGMVGSVAAALVGIGLPEPYDRIVMAVAATCAALTGYNVTHPEPPREVWSDADRDAHRGELGIAAATLPGPGPSAHSANR